MDSNIVIINIVGAAHTRKILFVVPKVVLADQQLEVIRGQLEGLPPQYAKVRLPYFVLVTILMASKGQKCYSIVCFVSVFC